MGTNLTKRRSNAARGLYGSRDSKRMECPSALVGGGISLFHQPFPVANYPELAQRAIWYQLAERDRALSNHVGHEIGVVTKKRSAAVAHQAARGRGHGRRQWHNRWND